MEDIFYNIHVRYQSQILTATKMKFFLYTLQLLSVHHSQILTWLTVYKNEIFFIYSIATFHYFLYTSVTNLPGRYKNEIFFILYTTFCTLKSNLTSHPNASTYPTLMPSYPIDPPTRHSNYCTILNVYTVLKNSSFLAIAVPYEM